MTVSVYSLAGWVLLAAGVAATGVQLSRLAWQVADAAAPDRQAPATTDDAGDTRAKEELARLIAANPFGMSARTDQSGFADAGAASQLTLLAIRLSTDETASTATLSLSGGAAQIYRIGDEVGGLGTLTRIEARRAVIALGGEELMIEFPAPATAARLPQLYAAKAAEYPLVAGPAENSNLPASEIATNSIRTQMAANPKVLIESFGLETAGDGYIVGPGAPPVLLAAGLKPGDKVVKVNGSPLGGGASDQLLFDKTVASGRARVEVLREGQTIILYFPLK